MRSTMNKNKIFGVGAQRTGTTSLARALRVLSIKTADWPEHHEQLNAIAKSGAFDADIFNEYDAFVDLPVPVLFKELDKHFPYSKFILTLRDENEWLVSVNRHQENLRRIRMSTTLWDSDRLFYKTDTFDENVALSRYREHINDVLDYFEYRPEDLLIIDLTKGSDSEKWGLLCAFLEIKYPDTKFPHKNIGWTIKRHTNIEEVKDYCKCLINRTWRCVLRLG